MYISSNIRYLRKKNGLSQEQLAERLGYKSFTTIQKWESGVSEPPLKTVHALANMFHVDIDDLTKSDLEQEKQPAAIPPGYLPLPKMKKVPLVGRIACGAPIMAEENLEGYVDAPVDCQCDFSLVCVGNSMIDANIHDGDIVYVRLQPTVENGEIAVVRIGDEATLKRVYLTQDSITLIPANTAYAPVTFTGREMSEVHIEGKAIGYTHMFK